MSSNIREFNLSLGAFERQIPERVAQVHRAITLEALNRVVLRSPVDKGRFRGNWQVSHDTPAEGRLERLDKSGSQTIAEGAAEVAKIRPYEITWLVNNLAYAQSLEDGHSKQAPGGVVEPTVQELRSHFG